MKLAKEEIEKVVDGCYYGQAMSFDENQIIKEFIEQQRDENEELSLEIERLKVWYHSYHKEAELSNKFKSEIILMKQSISNLINEFGEYDYVEIADKLREIINN